jgi:hypothetical protein
MKKLAHPAESVDGLWLGEVAQLVIKGYALALGIPTTKGFADRIADSQVKTFYPAGVVLFFCSKIVRKQLRKMLSHVA